MKTKTQFVCQQCGRAYSKWMGKCQECGQWNAVVEERAPSAKAKKRGGGSEEKSLPTPVTQVLAETLERQSCGSSELDNVLGGGLVPGAAVLLGGEPGIGKSTLLLQLASHFAKSKKAVLYASGEESSSQIALRAKRLGVSEESLFILSETCSESILDQVDKVKPELLIIDSIQTIRSAELESQPGSVGQLRECANQIVQHTKDRNIPTFFVGHVTKDGAIAGPKVLEHLVDVVLYFEGTSNHSFRLLRSIKNRFGSTNELGVFEMKSEGMAEVTNPSELFLAERTESTSGSAIAASVEGSRPLLVEVQALVSQTPYPQPRRTAIGFDPNRLSLLVAILEKRLGMRFFDQDVYVNIAGGLRLIEPAADLAVVASILSSFSSKPTPQDTVFFGEIGLGGEVRSVPRTDSRLKEAKRIGFKRALVPKRVLKEAKGIEDFELIPVEQVGELSDFL